MKTSKSKTTKGKLSNYTGRQKGATNKANRYEVMFMHPIHHDVCIETKRYKSLYLLANDLGISRHSVCRLLKKGGNSTIKITNLRTVTVNGERV